MTTDLSAQERREFTSGNEGGRLQAGNPRVPLLWDRGTLLHPGHLKVHSASGHQAPALSSGPFIGLNKPELPIHRAGDVARECEVSG